MSDTTNRIVTHCLLNLPGAQPDAIRLQMFEVVDDLTRNWLQIAPPVGTDPDTWMADAVWQQHYRLVIDGVIGRMAMQLSRPYTDEKVAAAHMALYANALMATRPIAMIGQLDFYNRVVKTIGLRVPQARDNVIVQQMYETIDELRRDGLDVAAADPTAADPSTWLTQAQWGEYFRLVIEGTVSRLKSQSGLPWSDDAGAQSAAARYGALMGMVRANLLQNTETTNLARLIANAKARARPARAGQVIEALWETVTALTRDLLEIPPPGNLGSSTGVTGGSSMLPVIGPDGTTTYIPQNPAGGGTQVTNDPASWLNDAQYGEHYRVLLNGTCFHLLSDTGAPYADPERAKLYAAEWQAGLARVRGEVTKAISQTYYLRAVENVRIRVPAARTPLIQRHMFDVLTVITQDALQSARPITFADPTTWFTEANWSEHYKAVVEGTVAALVPGDPAGQTFASMLQRMRANAATGTAASAYERVMQNIRVHIGPAARDGVIQMELYNTVDEVCREALYRDPPDNAADPSTWMSDAEYARYLRLLVSGTLMRLHAQTQPYADAGQVSIHAQVYAKEMVTARTDATGGPNQSRLTQFFDTIRLQCQGIKDATINLEYYNAALDFAERGWTWRRTIVVPLVKNTMIYAVTPPIGTSIIDILEVGHKTLDVGRYGWLYDRNKGQIAWSGAVPTDADLTFPLLVRVVLRPEPTTGDLVPADILRESYHPILDATLARLFKLPGRPWTNPTLAAYHGRRASNETGLARARKREEVANTSRLCFPIFARG